MANHARQQVREALSTIVTGLTTTQGRVFQSRVYPVDESELPCLLVTTDEEENEYLNTNYPSAVQRSITATVKAVVENIADLDDAVDNICKEVEIAVHADITLGGIVSSVHLASTEIEIDTEGKKPVGVATMLFACVVFTLETTPDVLLT